MKKQVGETVHIWLSFPSSFENFPQLLTDFYFTCTVAWQYKRVKQSVIVKLTSDKKNKIPVNGIFVVPVGQRNIIWIYVLIFIIIFH